MQTRSPRIERQTVPDGKTFGWKSGGVNLPVVERGVSTDNDEAPLVAYSHFGGLLGYSSGKLSFSLYRPPLHFVYGLGKGNTISSLTFPVFIAPLSNPRWPFLGYLLPMT